jgi:vancomycin permeability regulator SanA
VPAGSSSQHAILVLGYALTSRGEIAPRLERRLELGLAAARADPSALVVVSGGAVRSSIAEAAAMRDWFERRGVPADRIQVEDRSRITLENVENSAAVLARAKVGRVTLVTDSTHVARAHRLLNGALRHAQVDAVIDEAVVQQRMRGWQRLSTAWREWKAYSRDAVNQLLMHRGHPMMFLGPQLLAPGETEDRIDWGAPFRQARSDAVATEVPASS